MIWDRIRCSTSRQPEDKREAILEAALHLFAEQGYNGTTVPEVAHSAGVGAGTIYRYFKSKEVLVNTLYRKWKSVLTELLLHDFPFDRPQREQFHEFFARQLRFALDYPEAFTFLELHHHGSYLDRQSRAQEDSLIKVAEEYLGNGQKQQVLRDGPPMLLLAMVYGAIVGLVRASREGRLELTDKVLDQAEQSCWELIRN